MDVDKARLDKKENKLKADIEQLKELIRAKLEGTKQPT